MIEVVIQPLMIKKAIVYLANDLTSIPKRSINDGQHK